VEQSGKADDNVEAERQSRVGQRICRRVDIGVVANDDRKQHRQHGDERDHDPRPQMRRDPLQRRGAPEKRKSLAADTAAARRRTIPANHQARAAVARPSSPFGTNTSTSTKIEKIKTSAQRCIPTVVPVSARIKFSITWGTTLSMR